MRVARAHASGAARSRGRHGGSPLATSAHHHAADAGHTLLRSRTLPRRSFQTPSAVRTRWPHVRAECASGTACIANLERVPEGVLATIARQATPASVITPRA